VGKSTLFNRLTKSRQAIVSDEAGTTRDRQYGKCEWCGREFSVVDTGGWVVNSDDIFEEEIRKQVVIATEEADLVLFLCDIKNGVTDWDQDVAQILRRNSASKDGKPGTGVPVILDTSGELLREGIRACPTMVKPNTDEIGQLLGRCVSSLDEVARAASDLHEQGIQKVVVSLGGDGALMACDEGVFRGIAPAIEVVNPVGAGDTMVGAFAVGIARGMAPDAQLAYAMSCASANCLSPSTGHFDMGVARDLLSRTTVEKIA
jgi:fructose-1-phosphate kinase PfkB-like protein